MKDTFRINKNSRIYLYGAASIGKIVYSNLINAGYSVEKFIDKRAEEISEFIGVPVILTEQLSNGELDDAVVIISVKNVFEHKNIIDIFIRRGYSKLIYMPDGVLNGHATENDKKIEKMYNGILSGNIIEMELPVTKEVPLYIPEDCAVALDRGDTCIVRVPWQLIYTYKRNSNNSADRWTEVNCMQYFPHIELFTYFMNGCGECESYMEFCCEAAIKTGDVKITEAWKENVIKNRYDVYNNMNMKYELDKDFFVRSAPKAEWNDKGYFNLISGKHRTSFLLSKGNRYINVEISKEDYKKWMKYYDFDIEKIHNDNTGRWKWHPYMFKYIYENRNYEDNIQKVIIYNMTRKWYGKYKSVNLASSKVVLDIDNFSYMRYLLEMMGVNVVDIKDCKNGQEYDFVIIDKSKELMVRNMDVKVASFIQSDLDCGIKLYSGIKSGIVNNLYIV